MPMARRPWSVRSRLLVPLLLAVGFVAVVGVYLVGRTYSGQLNQQMQLRGESIAGAVNLVIRDVRSDTSDPADISAVRRFVADLASLPDVTLAVVVSGDPAVVLASTRADWIGQPLTALPYERVQEDLFDAIETRRMHPHFHWDTLEYDVSWPLALSTMHRPRGEPSDGAVMLHLDARPVRAQFRRAAFESTLVLFVAITVAGGVMWWMLDRIILRRVDEIESAMERRSAGSPDVFATVRGNDEIGRLATSLNEMLHTLDTSKEELRRARDTLEEEVEARTADLATTNSRLSVELDERRRAEKALRETHERLRHADRMAMIGSMAAGVAHDLSNLLLPIRIRVDVLNRDSSLQRHQEAIDDLRQGVRFLQQLAENLRMCAIDGAEESGAQRDTDISAWWRDVGGLLSRAFSTRSGDKAAVIDTDLTERDAIVAIAPHRLTQLMLNLFVNAGDACRGMPSPRLEVRSESADGDGPLRIGVRDNGIGMSERVAENAFDPFFTTKARGASTGLGLSLVRSIAESVGGSVVVETAPGKGSRFTIELPCSGSGGEGRQSVASHRTAAVTLDDERLEGFVLAELTSFGLHTATSPSTELPLADIWVVDDANADETIVEAFLDKGKDRRVILVSSSDNEGWHSSRITKVGVSLDSDELQRAVQAAGSEPDDDGIKA